MGQPVDLSTLFAQAASTGMTTPVLMVVVAVQTLFLGPFLGLAHHIWRRIRLARLFAARINEFGARARGGSGWYHLGHLALAGHLDGL